MLLTGMVNAMPVPGTSMFIVCSSCRFTAFQRESVTVVKITAFSVRSSPR